MATAVVRRVGFHIEDRKAQEAKDSAQECIEDIGALSLAIMIGSIVGIGVAIIGCGYDLKEGFYLIPIVGSIASVATAAALMALRSVALTYTKAKAD